MRPSIFYIFVLTILNTPSIYAQNTCTICEKLKKNVVKIQTTIDDKCEQFGFGTVIAEKNNKLYIVTAKHVIYASEQESDCFNIDIKTKSASIQFYSDQGKIYSAIILNPPNTSLDIGLLEVEKPKDYIWEKDSYSTAIQKGTRVWFIGRAGKWYTPEGSSIGSINEISSDDKILVDINSIQPGTSGAPLISEDGIVGLIIEDELGNETRAYPIEKVIKLIDEWKYPWQMNPAKKSPDSNDELLTDEEITEKIVGTWKGILSCEGYSCEATITYNSNGNFTGTTIVNNQIYYNYSGRWKVTDSENVLTITNSSNQLLLPIGTRLTSKILTFTNNTSQYIDYMGIQRTAYRLN